MSRLTIAAVRGAISVRANTRAAIHAATWRLLAELATRNRLDPRHVVSALFTTPPGCGPTSRARASQA